jgi:single-strand DNA-binding protein
VFSEPLCKLAEQYLHKGSRILVQGAFSVREWEAQYGSKRYATEVVLQGFDAKLQFLDAAQGRGESETKARRLTDGQKMARDAAFASGDDFGDEIPF